MQKTARKSIKYLRNKTILKIKQHAKAIDLAKSSLWVKTKIPKKHVKMQSIYHLELFCAKKTRNKTILKMGHHAKAMALEKSSLWVKYC